MPCTVGREVIGTWTRRLILPVLKSLLFRSETRSASNVIDFYQNNLITLFVSLISRSYQRTGNLIFPNPRRSFLITDLFWLKFDPVICRIADIYGMQFRTIVVFIAGVYCKFFVFGSSVGGGYGLVLLDVRRAGLKRVEVIISFHFINFK